MLLLKYSKLVDVSLKVIISENFLKTQILLTDNFGMNCYLTKLNAHKGLSRFDFNILGHLN